jgi:lipopolysaccharide/colanic/teichoic acid biosynthesis glycosyltransferase/glycosyltransferase involved in cell wall biosynthesis
VSTESLSSLTVEGGTPDRFAGGTARGGAGWIDSAQAGTDFAMAVRASLPLCGPPLSWWSHSRAKRLFDVACVVPVLLLLVPMLVVIAVAVRITSRGPVLFLQKRMGRYGGWFTIAKFRTMIHSEGVEHNTITTEGNQQFTSIGPFLRRWKLDELPQLINVLLGDMSLVGPRPKVRDHRVSVLRCRPGITGAATIAFADEETVLDRIPQRELESCYRTLVLPAKRQIDSAYMARATMLSDLQILVRSVLRRWDTATVESLLGNGMSDERGRPDSSDSITDENEPPAGNCDTPMRLAILGTRGIPARYGGFETFAEQLALRLAARGADVTVYCPTSSARSNVRYHGVTLRYVTSHPLGALTELLWDIKCFWKARRGSDVVYMLGVGAGFAAWIPRMFGTVVWINSDGMEWKRAKWSLLQRAYLAAAEAASVLFASRIVADADTIAEYLRKRYPMLKKISTIAYGADIPTLTPSQQILQEWRLKAEGYYLVVCRMEPENNVLEILEGFERAKSSLPLVVLGNVANPNAYVRRLLEFRCDRIRFAGTLYDKDRLNALRYYARAYFHGHSVGGTNPSLLEAMACSNLVIAHDNPFNREVLGDAGLHWSSCDELASIVKAVDGLAVDAAMRGERASEIVRSRYQWDHIADVYLGLLKDALKVDAGARIGQLHSGTIVSGTGMMSGRRGSIPVGRVARVHEVP